MKYHKNKRDKMFEVYKRLQDAVDPLTNITELEINVSFYGFKTYPDTVHPEIIWIASVTVEDPYNAMYRRNDKIFEEHIWHTKSDAEITSQINNTIDFVNKFIADNKNRDIRFIEDDM